MNAIVSSRLAHYELLSSLGTILLARGRPKGSRTRSNHKSLLL